MAFTRITAYAFDYQLGNAGTVYFKLEGDPNPHSTGAIPTDAFNAVCNVLKTGPSLFDPSNGVFRSAPPHAAAIGSITENFVAKNFRSAKIVKNNVKGKRK